MKPTRKRLAGQKVELVFRGELTRKMIALELKKLEMDGLMIRNALALGVAAVSGWKMISAWRKRRKGRP